MNVSTRNELLSQLFRRKKFYFRAKISKENQKSNTNLKGTFILTIFENLNVGKNRELQVVHRELQGLETYEKIVNCKFVNYETVNYEDPL